MYLHLLLLHLFLQPVCETKTHTNTNGDVYQYWMGCKQRNACEAPGRLGCKQNGPNEICVECGYGVEGEDYECGKCPRQHDALFQKMSM